MTLRKWKSGWDWGASVYVVDEGNAIIEELAQCANIGIGLAAYKEAKKMRTYSLVQLRERARIVRTAKTGAYNSETREVEILWEI